MSAKPYNDDRTFDDQGQTPDEDISRFKWEELPLEVFETLVKHIDGLGLVNLCLSSPYIAQRVLEPFSHLSSPKREAHWYKFCMKNLDRSLVCKIISSFVGSAERPEDDTAQILDVSYDYEWKLCGVTWEDVFFSYLSYWTVMVNEKALNQRLCSLENKLKSEMLHAREVCNLTSSDVGRDSTIDQHLWTIRSGGGKVILNVMLPFPYEEFKMNVNAVVTEVSRDVICKHLSTICWTGRDFFGLKIVQFPIMRIHDGSKNLHFDRVVLSVCNECVSTSPLLGGVTRRMTWPESRRDDGTLRGVERCPVFEVHDNIIVVWTHPGVMTFLLMVAGPEQEGYEFCLLYRLQFDGMEDVWDKIAKYSSCYLPVVQEYEGNDVINQHARDMLMGGSEYFCHPTKPVHYGLNLASPISENHLFKPSGYWDNLTTTVESFKPLYFFTNANQYLNRMRQPTCSAKGHGYLVFCSNTAIAVSWDSRTWIFGDLTFPTIHADDARSQNLVTHVEVTNHNNALLLVVNQDILLAEFVFKKRGHFDPELEVKPLRCFQTQLTALDKEITQIELSFDHGSPNLLIVAKQRPREVEDIEQEKVKQVVDEFNFAIMRVNFEGCCI